MSCVASRSAPAASRCSSTTQPTPKPTGTEVLLKVLAAGVCHSDLHLSDGYFDLGGGKKLSVIDRGMKLPVTLGHENVGEVVAIGPGRRASRSATAAGRSLDGLRRVRRLQARRRAALPQAAQPRRVPPGGYSDYLMVPHPRYLFDIGDIPPETRGAAGLLGVTTYGALKKVGPTLTTDPTVIIGAGGLGLMCIALHKAMGGHSSIVVDIDPGKRDAALKAGAKAVIDGAASDAAAQIIAATNGGAWAVIDLVGSSSTARLGIDSLIKGGKLIIVGLYGGDITVSLPPFPMRAITVQGSYTGSLNEIGELIELVKKTGLPPVPVATRPLDDVNAVLSDLRAGKIIGRVVLTPA